MLAAIFRRYSTCADPLGSDVHPCGVGHDSAACELHDACTKPALDRTGLPWEAPAALVAAALLVALVALAACGPWSPGSRLQPRRLMRAGGRVHAALRSALAPLAPLVLAGAAGSCLGLLDATGCGLRGACRRSRCSCCSAARRGLPQIEVGLHDCDSA